MRLHKFRARYWSNSTFSDWLYSQVGVTKPDSATFEGWDEWNKTTYEQHPTIYWINEELLRKIQDFVSYPKDVWNSFHTWVTYSFIKHTPLINTKLPFGDFHGTETLILHGMFSLLEDFVECEKASMYVWSHHDHPRPWWMKSSLTRWKQFRNPYLGLKYLEWEVSLGDDCKHQSEAAQKVIELYNWWKYTRPNRIDPYEASGLNAYYASKEKGKAGLKMAFSTERSEEEKQAWNIMHKKCKILEEGYDLEDTDKLIQLIKIRNELWT